MPQLDERGAIIATLGGIRDSRARLLQQRDALNERLVEQDNLERYWQSRLVQLEGAGAGQSAAHRVRKGEPLRRLIDALGESGQGCSIPELCAATGLSQSTVRATLLRNTDRFQELDGKWFKKRIERTLLNQLGESEEHAKSA